MLVGSYCGCARGVTPFLTTPLSSRPWRLTAARRRISPRLVGGGQRHELPEDLDRIVTLAIRIDARLEDRRRMAKQRSPPRYFSTCRRPSPTPLVQRSSTHTPAKTESGVEAEVMMVDLSKLTKRRTGQMDESLGMPVLWRNRTLYLDLPGKRARPLVERGALVGAFQIESSTRSHICLPVTLNWTGGTKRTSALLDSGAEESFLDAEAAVRWGIPLVEVSRPLVANSLNGQNIGGITKATIPLHLLVSGNHQETISLLIIDTPYSPVILGHPWMVKHSGGGLEEPRDLGLEPHLFDKVSPEVSFSGCCSSARGSSEPS